MSRMNNAQGLHNVVDGATLSAGMNTDEFASVIGRETALRSRI